MRKFKFKNKKKFLILGVVNKEKDKLLHEYAFNNSINLMSKKDNNSAVIHTINGNIEVSIGETIIDFNEDFHKILEKIVWTALEDVKITPTRTGQEKGNYIETKKGNIESCLYGLITRWEINKENIDILELAIDLLIRICCSHLISNGNKRLSLISCSMFLHSIGIYFKWSNDKEFYIKYWEDLMINLASGKYGQDLDEIKNNKDLNIREIFLNSIMISNKYHYI